MTGRTRCFWLLSDNKTVREVSIEEARKQVGRKRHVIYVHKNTEFYTTRGFVPFAQFWQCTRHLMESEKA